MWGIIRQLTHMNTFNVAVQTGPSSEHFAANIADVRTHTCKNVTKTNMTKILTSEQKKNVPIKLSENGTQSSRSHVGSMMVTCIVYSLQKYWV